MGKINNLTDFLTDVADAIREKKGTTDLINPQDFSDEIRNIESGGIINESELPLYMEADSSFNVKFVGNDIQYSFDNKSWNNVVSDTFISIELEQRVYFRAFNLVPNSTNGIGNFATDAEYETNFKVGGNIMSMLMGVDTSDITVAPENAFRQIFGGKYQ